MSLLVSHLVGDFLLQNDWMAMNKKKRAVPLTIHCLVYTSCIWLIGGLGGLPLLFVFLSHLLIDGSNVISMWMNLVGQRGFKDNLAPWSVIVVDQVWHLLILFVLTL
jgi:hypothetical protein